MKYKLTIYETDDTFTYTFDTLADLDRQLNSMRTDLEEEERRAERKADYEADMHKYGRRPTPYERTRAAVYATGNRWAIENFNATH